MEKVSRNVLRSFVGRIAFTRVITYTFTSRGLYAISPHAAMVAAASATVISRSVSRLASSSHRPITIALANRRCFSDPGLSPTRTTANREAPNPGPEMGIANTTVAATLCAALMGGRGARWAGRGTGVDDAGLLRKRTTIDTALKIHRNLLEDPLAVPAAQVVRVVVRRHHLHTERTRSRAEAYRGAGPTPVKALQRLRRVRRHCCSTCGSASQSQAERLQARYA